MNKVLLITDTLNKHLYTTLKVSSRTALKGIDHYGQDLTQLTPEYIENGTTRQGCCGIPYSAVGFNSEDILFSDFKYLLSRVRLAGEQPVVDASIVVMKDVISIDMIDYKSPESLTDEFVVELYEALTGDRSVLEYLEVH